LSQSSRDLIQALQLSASSWIQASKYGIDCVVRMVAGVGNRDVYLAGSKQHPWKPGIASRV
jgi:hypothetical protein